VRKRPNFISEISLINLESCVGICDVFCLEQIIVNLLQLSSQQAAINPIQVKVSRFLAKYLEIKIEFNTNPIPAEQVLNIFKPLVEEGCLSIDKISKGFTEHSSPDRSQRQPLFSLSDLSLTVVHKCVDLLQGNIELAAGEYKITLKVKLPLVLVI
ncbi:MAG: hypothetical protein AAF383_13975, partial [Cyanobacteria bacterium P01_A01_bin.83]